MIDLIYRSKVPAYRGATSTPQGRTTLISGLWCYLFGGGDVPGYRTATTSGATAPTVSRCWWSLTGSPQYQAPPARVPSDPEPEVSPCDGEPMAEDCPCEPRVEGREMHIYPAE